MAFKTKSEKKAFRIGLLRGLFRKKKGRKEKTNGGTRKKPSGKYKSNYKKKPYKTPPSGAYTSRGRINENRVDGLSGPVVFWDDGNFCL